MSRWDAVNEWYILLCPLGVFIALLFRVFFSYTVYGKLVLYRTDAWVCATFLFQSVITAVGYRFWLSTQTKAQPPADPHPGPAVIVDP